MKILGIDYGDKNVGLAKSEGKLAVPWQILENRGNHNLVQKIERVCQEEDIEKIVVGLPLTLAPLRPLNKIRGKQFPLGLSSGRRQGGPREQDLKNKQTRKVLTFVKLLRGNLKIPIVTEDERMSSKMANGLAKGKIKGEKDDAVAAMLILQTYLDKNEK